MLGEDWGKSSRGYGDGRKGHFCRSLEDTEFGWNTGAGPQ